MDKRIANIINAYHLDKARIRRSFDRAAPNYDDAAVLQREVAERLLARLDLVRLQPQRILDVGAGTGYCTRALSARYKNAEVVALDIAPAMLQAARGRQTWMQRWRGGQRFVCGDAEHLPLAANCVDLIVSNLTVQWCADLDAVFSEFWRILRPGGLLMISTFGPDTLSELRASWAAVDNAAHVSAFTDMHDIGDALVRARYADPVMDVEHFTVTYPDVVALMRDLKRIGAHNAALGRTRGLTGKGRLAVLQAAYEAYRRNGQLPATYEVAYGHAWAPAVKNVGDHRGPFVVPVSSIGRRR